MSKADGSILTEEEARHAAKWLAELRGRQERLEEQMPEDFDSVSFEYWAEQYMNLSRQIDLLERMLGK